MMIPFLQITGLTKTYGGVHALSAVDLDIMPGSIHALMGENGAGKSTFIKCLAGAVKPDRGKIRVDGSVIATGDIRASEAAGIVAMHQESTAFAHLDAVDNICVGREIIRRLPLLSKERAGVRYQGLVRRHDCYYRRIIWNYSIIQTIKF